MSKLYIGLATGLCMLYFTSGTYAQPTFTVTPQDISVEIDEMFSVDIVVTDFTNILSMQYSISWNDAVIDFVSVTNITGTLPGFSVANLGQPGQGSVPTDVMTTSWLDADLGGESLPDGSVLLTLNFQAIANGTTNIAFGDVPVPIEVVDSGTNLVGLNSGSSTVVVGTGQDPGSDEGFEGFGLTIDDVVGQPGDVVCMEVSVQEFDEILGMQFTINYQVNALSFESVGGFNLAGLSAANFGTPPNTAAGSVTFSWLDNNLTGITLADGTVIFEVCFTVLGNLPTDVVFGNSPTEIEVVNLSSEILPFDFEEGTVTDSPPVPGLDLNISEISLDVDQDGCVSLSVQDFDNITSLNLVINYNNSNLDLVSVGNFNLTGLDAGDFNTATPGTITLNWSSQNGVSRSNGTDIFDICFSATGSAGTYPVTFNSATATDTNGSLNVNTNNGSVTITALEGFYLIMTDPTVCPDDGNNFCIDVSVNDFIDILGIQFSINYNPTQLQFISLGNFGLPDMSNASFGTPPNTPPGIITSSWLDNDLQGVTIPNGQVIFEICFQNLQPEGNTSFVVLSDNTTPIEITALGDVIVPFNADGATVKVSCVQPMTVTADVSNVSCFGGSNGSISLSVVGGAGPFQYNWSPGAPNSPIITGLSPGSYSVTVTGSNNQQYSDTYDVGQPMNAITVTTNIQHVFCAADQTGAINAAFQGGLPPYSIDWPAPLPDNVLNQSGLGAGIYAVTVTDNNDCVTEFDIAVHSQVEPISLNVISAIIQPGGTGSATANIDLDHSEVTFSWSGPEPNLPGQSSIAVGTPGTYCVTVTDIAEGCVEQNCIEVEAAFGIHMFSIVPTCEGLSQGGVDITVLGGTPNYSFVWTNEMGETVSTQEDLSGVPPGNYQVKVSDNGGNQVNGNFEIALSSPIMVADTLIVHDSDVPGCNGSISLELEGGMPPYEVTWNAMVTGPEIINLCAGLFVPTIVDANGCEVTLEDGFEVTTFALDADVADTECPNESNGGIDLLINGGQAPYMIEWTNEEGETISTAEDLTGVPQGIYTVTVQEQSGNASTRTFTIGTTSSLGVALEVLSTYNGYHVSCVNSSDGVVKATAGGGEGAYFYEWGLNGTVVGTAALLNNTSAGLHIVTVTDEAGCEISSQVNLTAPVAITIDGHIEEVSCRGDKNGEVRVTAFGGINNLPYSYRWSNNDIGPLTTHLAAGSYTVSVTDVNNCVAEATFEVPEPDPLEIIIESEPATEDCNGMIRVVAGGGTEPYTYDWANIEGVAETNPLATGLCPGTYGVKVIDANGCVSEPELSLGSVDDRRFPCFEERVVITPDGDGLNDEFLIFCIDELIDNHLEIYNRWGQLVYRVENYDNTWEGVTNNGDELPEGPYYFILEYKDPDNNPVQRKGSISLIRE